MQRELAGTEIEELLQLPWFGALSGPERAHLLPHVGVVEAAAGQRLFSSGDTARTVYVIRRGAFLAHHGQGELVLEAGFLGAELMLGSERYLAHGTALTDASAFAIPAAALREVAAGAPALKVALFGAFAAFSAGLAKPGGAAVVAAALEAPLAAAAAGAPADAALETGLARVLETGLQSPLEAGPQSRLETGPQSTLDTGPQAEAQAAAPADAPPPRQPYGEVAGWLAAMLLPLAVWHGATAAALPRDAAYFLSIVACTAALWLFNLVPAFVPPLFSLLAIIVFDVAPPAVAAAGFASNGFFMLLSVFAVGAVMVMSGLTYRISLWILRCVPAGPFWYNLSLLFYGLLLTPVIPSQVARMVIVAPFFGTLVDASGRRGNGLAASHLAVSTLAGVGLLASVFLTGKPANLMVFGLFDAQTQFSFEWLAWLSAAAFSAALLVLGQLLLSNLMFRRSASYRIAPPLVAAQLRALGRMGRQEWAALLAIGAIVLGVLSAPYHRVEIPWLALAVLVVLLLFGALRNDDLSRRVDWSVLLFIGSIIAWVPVMKSTGVDADIATGLGGVGALMKAHFAGFVAALCLLIVVLRLALPELVVEMVLVTVLFPVAGASGVSQWLVGFIILTMAEAYIFPYQAPYHQLLRNQLRAQGRAGWCDERQMLRFNLAMTALRAGVLFASFPFWSLMDII